MNGYAMIVNEKLDLIKGIEGLELQKKAIENREKSMREALQKAMEEYNVYDLEVGNLHVIYVGETTRTAVDTKKVKELYPVIADECSKTTTVKPSIRISVKEEA